MSKNNDCTDKDNINSEPPGFTPKNSDDDVNHQRYSPTLRTHTNSKVATESTASSSSLTVVKKKRRVSLFITDSGNLRSENPDSSMRKSKDRKIEHPWTTAFLDQRHLGTTSTDPILLDSTEDSASAVTPSTLSLEQLEPIRWTGSDFHHYQRQWNCQRNREKEEAQKELDIALLGRKQAEELIEVTELARKKAEELLADHLVAQEIARAEFEDQLQTAQTQRDEARAEVKDIKDRTEAIWKQRVDIYRKRSQVFRRETEDFKRDLKVYQDSSVTDNLKIEGLEDQVQTLRDKLDDALSDLEEAQKEIQQPSQKLLSALHSAQKTVKTQAHQLARLEVRKGKYLTLTPPFRSAELTVQQEFISDLTSCLILLSKWCDIKEVTEAGVQAQRLQNLLSDPEGVPYPTALASLSLLVRQLSFLHLHLEAGRSEGPGTIHPNHLLDIQGFNSLISHQFNTNPHLSVETQIDYNCCDPEGFVASLPQNSAVDHRRGLQDSLYNSSLRVYQDAAQVSQSSSTSQGCSRTNRDELFAAAQLNQITTQAQRDNQITTQAQRDNPRTSESTPSGASESPEAEDKPSSS